MAASQIYINSFSRQIHEMDKGKIGEKEKHRQDVSGQKKSVLALSTAEAEYIALPNKAYVMAIHSRRGRNLKHKRETGAPEVREDYSRRLARALKPPW